MDLLALYITGKIIHKNTTKPRLISASAVGGALGTAVTLLDRSHPLLSIIIGLIISFVMALIAFKTRTKAAVILRDTVVMWGVGALLGGVMTALMSIGEPVYSGEGEYLSVFTVCAFLSVGLVRLLLSGTQRTSADMTVEYFGGKLTLRGLCDSGNIAKEPISSLPVVILSKNIVPRETLEKLKVDPSLGMRLVLLRGIGGERMLCGFKPKKIVINKTEVEAFIAVDDTEESFGGFDAIIPSVLIKFS